MAEKTDWMEKIAAELHQGWMDFQLHRESEGAEDATKHKHYVPWAELHTLEDAFEAMNQDRFQAAQVLRAFAKGDLTVKEQLPSLIHDSCLLWIKLAGDEPQDYHVPYHVAAERSHIERGMQTERVWAILQQIGNIDEIRMLDWLP